MGTDQNMEWDSHVQACFDALIGKAPAVMQDFARKKVMRKLEMAMAKEGRLMVTEKDMVDAFFAATPFGFHGPMKCDMEALGIDYAKYGHPK